jgi:hypothetical protein
MEWKAKSVKQKASGIQGSICGLEFLAFNLAFSDSFQLCAFCFNLL